MASISRFIKIPALRAALPGDTAFAVFFPVVSLVTLLRLADEVLSLAFSINCAQSAVVMIDMSRKTMVLGSEEARKKRTLNIRRSGH